MKIGYKYDSYPYKRNITGLIDEFQYTKVRDLYLYGSRMLRVLKKLHLFHDQDFVNNCEFSFHDFNLNKVDILHFFNNVSFGKTPWVSTFETVIPRNWGLLKSLLKQIDGFYLDKHVERGLEAIQSPSCKKIIAISESAKRNQIELVRHFPEYRDTLDKLIVMHPPQPLFVESFEHKQIDLEGDISFLLVGADFFRKGGLEVLRAFDVLRNREGLPIKLTIVSSLNFNDYATQSTQDDYEEAVRLISENSWITHHHHFPNAEIMKLMTAHHVGMLSTWADSYGYSVLEFQATGCPVISTDVRALPEINNQETGWVIQVPKHEFGESLFRTSDERKNLSHVIQTQLFKIIADIISDRQQIMTKSNRSIQRIREEHSPERYSKKLKEIYES